LCIYKTLLTLSEL